MAEPKSNNATLVSGSRAVININNSNISLAGGGSGTVANTVPVPTGIEKHQMQEPKKVDGQPKYNKDLVWLLEGKIVMYKNRPLSNLNRKVFHGRQQFLRDRWREVAVKLIENNEKNFKELDLLLKLHHSNIVQMFDAGEYQTGMFDYLYIVMELCEQNLRNYVHENPFNFQVSFSFLQQLAAGLAFLHENQVAHRDLKPDNVLISFDKKTAKLSDFGLGKEIPDGQSAASVTTIGAGTEGFKSPETYQSNTRVSPSVDIFPYGLVIHFTFTKGKHPYGNNPNEQSYNIMKNQNCNLSLIPEFDEPNGHKRAQLLDLLTQMLQHSPRDRPTVKDVKRHVFFTDVIRGDPEKIVEVDDLSKLTASAASSSLELKRKNQATPSHKVVDKRAKITDGMLEVHTKRIPKLEDHSSERQSAESPRDIARNSIRFTAAVIHIEGQFASLQKGYWKGKLVTIKEYKENERKSLERELRSLTVLRHNNIVELIGKISEEPRGLVLEHLKNGNLCDYLRRLGNVALSLVDRLDMTLQIVYGMTFLSNKKRIHGDLRAENIFVGKIGVYKIGGFHLSRSETEDGAVCNSSVRWSAPEVLSGGPVSTKSDVWSFGVVVFEIFASGENPYRGQTDAYVKERVLDGHRLQRPTSCPQNVFGMTSQCWDDDPKERPKFEKVQDFFQRYEKEIKTSTGDGAKEIEGGSSENDVKKMKQMQEIQDQLKKPLNEIGFSRSAQLLLELRELRGSDDLDILLQMAECELQLGRGKEEESIQRTRDFISNSGMNSARDARNMAYELWMSKCYVRSLITCRAFHDLHKSQYDSPNDAAKRIKERIVAVSHAAQPLIEAGGRPRDIGIKYGLAYMESLLNDLRDIKDVTPDVRVLNEVHGIWDINFSLNEAREYQKSISFGLKGLEILERRFGADASKNKIYGYILHNLGLAHHNSGSYQDAERYYVRSIESKEKAFDYDNENEKREAIELSRQNLATTRKSLGKEK